MHILLLFLSRTLSIHNCEHLFYLNGKWMWRVIIVAQFTSWSGEVIVVLSIYFTYIFGVNDWGRGNEFKNSSKDPFQRTTNVQLEMNDLNSKTYPISIHFMAFKVDLFPSFSFIQNGRVNEFDSSWSREWEWNVLLRAKWQTIAAKCQYQSSAMLLWCVCVCAYAFETHHTLLGSWSWSFCPRWRIHFVLLLHGYQPFRSANKLWFFSHAFLKSSFLLPRKTHACSLLALFIYILFHSFACSKFFLASHLTHNNRSISFAKRMRWAA